jgi:hypothetical protein
MESPTTAGTEFKPNRSKKNIKILYWVCGSFILIGLLVSGGELLSKGMLFAGFSLILLLIGHFFTSNSNVSYCINEKGITLRVRKKILNIPYSEIQSIDELKENQTEEFMLKLKQKQETEELSVIYGEKGAQLNPLEKIKEAFKIQAKAFAPYKYLSVPIMYESTGRRNHTKAVNLPCDTVFILLKTGEGFLISPLDTEGFVQEAKKFIN